ncbi:hypothetical protein [Motilimonas sp. KMU-193]|uniref:hypothetical protein n=1 Tax=Motilimonas sp. KMU-193 TaxID=3388668 RepID=UPI00396B251C
MKLPIKHILLSAVLLTGTAHANISDDMSAGISLSDSINNALAAGETSEKLFAQIAQTTPELLAQSFSVIALQPNQDVNALLAQALVASQSLDAQIQDDILVAAVELVKDDEALLLTLLETAINNSADEAQLDIIATTIASIGATEEATLALRLSIAKRALELEVPEDTLLAGYAASGADTAELEATAAGGPNVAAGTTPTTTGNGGGTGGGGLTASPN